MARYALNLPIALKQEAAAMAKQQGISLNQFILWAVADKVASLRRLRDDADVDEEIYRELIVEAEDS